MSGRFKLPEEAPTSWLPWLLIPLLAVLAFGLGRCLPELAEDPGADEHAEHEGETEGEATIWTCSMHPQIQQPEPGDCPICGMDLIPLSEAAGDAPAGDQVVLSERAKVLARIRTAEVQRIATPGLDVRLLGRVEVDENRVRNVSAWIGGRVDKLYVRETGVVVKRGQTIASLYSPEIYAAHQDLLTAGKQLDRLRNASELARSSAESALEAARERLSLLGVPDRELDRMLEAKRPRKSVAIRTSYGGTVMERSVTQGQYIETGTVLYRVADLSKLWVQLDAYETDLPALSVGQTVDIEVEALPGETFTGEVAFIDPLVDPRRRVAKVRVEVGNPEGELRPGMFAEAVVRGDLGRGDSGNSGKQKPLTVPATAPLFTGTRSLVYVEVPDAERPTYEPRLVELGPRMGDRYPVVAGLDVGERVVVHGAFAIDADLQIRGGPSMMAQPGEDERRGLSARVEADDELRAALAPVLRAYLAMQVALADDEWKQAKAAAEQLQTAVGAVEVEGEDAAEAWALIGPKLASHAEHAATSKAIEGARSAFLHLSMLTKELLQVFGNPLDEPVRLAFCPMANSDDGAEWIQAGEVVDNSYFGEAMLSCGEIRATVEPGAHLLVAAAPGKGGAPAGGHQH